MGGGSQEVSEYRYARNVADNRLKVGRNETVETLAALLHRCEVGSSCCGFNEGDRDQHIRDQVTNTFIR